jgi:hypothetical protein
LTYQERRRARRNEVKAVLLVALRDAAAHGIHVHLGELAYGLRCSPSTLRILWHELAAEGRVAYKTNERMAGGHRADITERELAERVALVREAKFRRWRRTGRMNLTWAELERVLP